MRSPSAKGDTHLCPTLRDPMHCSTPGFSVLHRLPELAQTHVNPVGDAIQPPHPLSPPSPLALNLSQHRVNESKALKKKTQLFKEIYKWYGALIMWVQVSEFS